MGTLCSLVRQKNRSISFFSFDGRIQCFARIKALKSPIKSLFYKSGQRIRWSMLKPAKPALAPIAGTFPSSLDLSAMCAFTSSSHRQEIRRIQLSRLYGHFTPCRLCARYLSSIFLLNYPTPMGLYNFQANPATYPSQSISPRRFISPRNTSISLRPSYRSHPALDTVGLISEHTFFPLANVLRASRHG